MAKSKMSAPRKSGNSTNDTPIIAMNLDDFLIEVASNTEDGDKGLRTIAKEIQKRYNRYPLLVAFIQHLGNLSDPADEEIPFINNPDIF